MNFEQPPEELRPENNADKARDAEESAFKKKIRKQLITGALLGASVIGGVTGAVYEANKADSESQTQTTERIEAHKFRGTVSEKITVPGHIQPMPTMVGKSIGVMPTMVPDAYSLKISTDSGDRLISVDKGIFDSVHVGDQVESADDGKAVTVEKQKQ